MTDLLLNVKDFSLFVFFSFCCKAFLFEWGLVPLIIFSFVPSRFNKKNVKEACVRKKKEMITMKIYWVPPKRGEVNFKIYV